MQFEDREKAYEGKFANDQQSMFKIEARASKLIGLWAAEKMGLSGADAENYAKEVIAANLDEPGYDDVKRKLQGDFDAKSVSIAESDIDSIIEKCVVEATKQLESNK